MVVTRPSPAESARIASRSSSEGQPDERKQSSESSSPLHHTCLETCSKNTAGEAPGAPKIEPISLQNGPRRPPGGFEKSMQNFVPFQKANNFFKTLKTVPFEVDWAFLTSKWSVFNRFGPPRSLENPAAANRGSRIFTKSAFGAKERSRVIIFRLLAIENRVPKFFRLLVIFTQFGGSQHGLNFGLKMALKSIFC